MPDFSFDDLRRFPDVEAPNLFAVDASDRLILDEAADALASAAPGEVVVIGDRYGALTLGAAGLHGATRIRVQQDALTGERALARNADRAGLADSYESMPFDASLVEGATVVLMQLPRTLAALDQAAALIARHAHPSVVVFAGGRIKHLSISMNEVLSKHFSELRVSLARQKSRVLVASAPIGTSDAGSDTVRSEFHDELGLWVAAQGTAFAGTKLDIGTRFLLSFIPQMAVHPDVAIDLGCGTGVLAAEIARARPEARVIASDQSSSAVASARETMRLNGLEGRVDVVRDDALRSQPDASAGLILCNPPFHVGAAVHADAALGLFRDAARVLESGGELWTVFNSSLSHAATLRKIVGPTDVVGQNAKFTVARSSRR
ncbi:16S rRNA m(2)G 1207 methyltransferase /23S rRNA m(2)G-1835 methyltransferase [Agreia bicolorata]|uniref:16S rRNA m(2)G 1207 methyltransferase /23S rRNA m(2)G-1835 methyltransferase n=1 Tax=Agreia bicolorata TaxID=110935 RepID=A0A1T4XH77_9MICO|nr:methyltransferase [Agreia bicolorata]SKA88849.1 16S rRNA m(2)G 1207 methyltransferase /23S rRNA m(2)G-1835 methyltransferase [Agreia bicolorata]